MSPQQLIAHFRIVSKLGEGGILDSTKWSASVLFGTPLSDNPLEDHEAFRLLVYTHEMHLRPGRRGCTSQ
jgi:hypothetical protein